MIKSCLSGLLLPLLLVVLVLLRLVLLRLVLLRLVLVLQLLLWLLLLAIPVVLVVFYTRPSCLYLGPRAGRVCYPSTQQ